MTIEQIVRWFVDTNGDEFARDIYGRDFHEEDGGYVKGKFAQMQRDPITWMANLDPQNRAKLEQLIQEK